MNKILFTFLVLSILALDACTPKVTEEVTKTEEETITPPPKVDENLSPCKKFSDAPNPDQAETDYVIYRDFLRAGDYEKSYEYWQKVYAVAPSADGKRNTVYSDGIRFYENFLRQETDSVKREEYIDQIFLFYDEIEECYGDKASFAEARKAFDLYYNYKNRASQEEIYGMIKAIIDKDGVETPYFVINPFAALLVDMYEAKKIEMEEARKYVALLKETVAHGVANCKGKACDSWTLIEGYTPERLEFFESVDGFYDCQYYVDKYFNLFEDHKDDCTIVKEVYAYLLQGNCPKDHPQMAEVYAYALENCVEKGALRLAYDALDQKRYAESIGHFEDYINESDDSAKKAKYALVIAKIYYGSLRNFSKSRAWARKAASFRSNWGEPYILIGRLYASSGPLCGPGRGWDSQIVVWPAIDKWKYAKSIDPNSAKEANKWIGQYARFMPSKEDIFQRNLKEGSTFKVGCWIQETTKIRAAPSSY